MRFLQPGEKVSRQEDPLILSLRVLPGLEKPFSALINATADYGYLRLRDEGYVDAALLFSTDPAIGAGDVTVNGERIPALAEMRSRLVTLKVAGLGPRASPRW